jgi:hypothetical protein
LRFLDTRECRSLSAGGRWRRRFLGSCRFSHVVWERERERDSKGDFQRERERWEWQRGRQQYFGTVAAGVCRARWKIPSWDRTFSGPPFLGLFPFSSAQNEPSHRHSTQHHTTQRTPSPQRMARREGDDSTFEEITDAVDDKVEDTRSALSQCFFG